MNAALLLMVLAFLLVLPVYWRLPAATGQTVLAVFSAVVLAALSPLSALWLGATALATPAVLRLGAATGRRGLAASVWIGVLVALLLGLRDISGPLWIGAAYFTLRHVHVTLDWWMGLLEPPATSDYLRYQFFLPVMAAGPINRFQRFQSETASRRWSAEDVFAGAERLLLGAFQVVVLGGWAMHRVEHAFNRQSVGWPDFQYEWTRSLIYWLDLYFTFAGLTSMALGLALMAGLRLEENFNRPWKSRTLAEFWTRWHITLSSWCRDYVFRPVAATSRRPALGVVLSMLAMGLWHGSSAYWIGWGLWQGLGIVLTRVAERHMPRRAADVLGGWVGSILGPVSVLAWLTLSRPVLVTLLGVAPP